MTTGTAGFGFVAIAPCLSNNDPVAYSTNSAYTGSDMVILSAVNTLRAGVDSISMANLPYASGDFVTSWASDSENVVGRIVSIGVRVTYVGTTLNESGVFYLYSSPTHQNVTRLANTTGELGVLNETEVCGVTRTPCEMRAFPVTPGEGEYSNSAAIPNKSTALYPYSSNNTDFNGNSFAASDGTTNVGSPIMVVAVSGLPAGASFLVEIIQHVEYAGLKAASNVTSSEADQRGYEIVAAASQRLPVMKNAQPDKSFLTLMKDAIGEVATALKPVAIDALKLGAMSLL